MRLALAIAVALLATPALAQDRMPAPKGARVYFIAPGDGHRLQPVHVVFGLAGMGVAPAGVEHENTGHHHLVVDAELQPFEEGIPADDNYRHFGGGQTEIAVELAPGPHTLQLLLDDQNHIPHDPPVYSAKITITVK